MVKKGKYSFNLCKILICFTFLCPVPLVQNDLTEMIDRLNKVENASKVKAKLTGAGLDQDMIDTILEALNETQERITAQTNEKLAVTGKAADIEELKNEMEVLGRRITFSEGVI